MIFFYTRMLSAPVVVLSWAIAMPTLFAWSSIILIAATGLAYLTDQLPVRKLLIGGGLGLIASVLLQLNALGGLAFGMALSDMYYLGCFFVMMLKGHQLAKAGMLPSQQQTEELEMEHELTRTSKPVTIRPFPEAQPLSNAEFASSEQNSAHEDQASRIMDRHFEYLVQNNKPTVPAKKKSTFMETAVAGVLGLMMFMYMSGVGIMTVYYNWDYARTNGFIRWVCFGQVIATAKGFTWPYHVYKGYKHSASDLEL